MRYISQQQLKQHHTKQNITPEVKHTVYMSVNLKVKSQDTRRQNRSADPTQGSPNTNLLLNSIRCHSKVIQFTAKWIYKTSTHYPKGSCSTCHMASPTCGPPHATSRRPQAEATQRTTAAAVWRHEPQCRATVLLVHTEATARGHATSTQRRPSLATLTCKRTEYQCIITSQTAPQLNLQLLHYRPA